MSTGFLKAFSDIEEARKAYANFTPMPVSLSTCTFTGKLEANDVAPGDQERVFRHLVYDRKLDLDLMASMDSGADFQIVSSDAEEESVPARKKRGSEFLEPKKKFHNQICLRQGTRSLKLFKNGSVHVTGCSSPMGFVLVVTDFIEFLSAEGLMPEGVTGFSLLNFTPVLINIGFVLHPPGHLNSTAGVVKVRPESLAKSIAASTLQPPNGMVAGHVDRETERHPGIKLPLFLDATKSKKVTISFYQTGSVSIAGAREPAHISAAFVFACGLLSQTPESLRTLPGEPLRKTTARQPFKLHDGYLQSHFDACFNAIPGNEIC